MIEKSPLAPLFQRGEFVFVLLFALFYLFGATQSADAQSLKKIRIASKGGGETLLPYLIPRRLGFYKEEGLDVDVIGVYDFAFVKKAYEEIRESKWDPLRYEYVKR